MKICSWVGTLSPACRTACYISIIACQYISGSISSFIAIPMNEDIAGLNIYKFEVKLSIKFSISKEYWLKLFKLMIQQYTQKNCRKLIFTSSIMFKCCTVLQNDIDYTDQIKPCKIHGKPILFVCLNYQTCQNKALFCTDCSDQHKGHTWETVSNFFNEEVKQILSRQSKLDQDKIKQVLDRTLENYKKARARIQYKLIQVQEALQKYFKQLIQKYPPIVGTQYRPQEYIDNDKMNIILQILRQRQINEWVDDFEEDFGALIRPTQQYTLDQLNDLEILIKNKQWDIQTERQKNFKSFLQKHFPAKQNDDPFYFRFSEADKNSYIKLSNKDLQAIYNDDTYENIQKPAVLTTRKLTPENNRVYFKINNITKTALIFDSSRIGLGVCIPHNARQYNFLNLHKHSHGAYLMFSDGRVFHSKLPEFIDSKAGFSFGKGDIVEMWVDYMEKVIHFQRKGLLKHKFEMQLSLNDKYMSKLRPFVIFEGDQGAVVQLLSTKKPKLQKSKSIKGCKTKSSKFTQASSRQF